jgi:soluble lytic murein transglycosylase
VGQAYLEHENFAAAAEQFRAALQSAELTEEERQLARLGLGEASLGLGETAAAQEVLGELLAASAATPGVAGPDRQAVTQAGGLVPLAYYRLGEAHREAGDCQGAIGAYETYLRSKTEVTAYILPLIAGCHQELGNAQAAASALEQASEAPAEAGANISLRFRAAESRLALQDFQAALGQYDRIIELAGDDAPRGRASFLAGQAAQQAGDTESAIAYFLSAVNDYPRAPDSRSALIALLDASVPVDEFQRGLVNFYARAYEPAMASFNRYLAANEEHREDAHLFVAWSAEALGNLEGALAQMDVYLEATTPQGEGEPSDDHLRGWLERARLLARSELRQQAIADYEQFLALAPTSDESAGVAWSIATLIEELGDPLAAAGAYRQAAEDYPTSEQAAEALYRAGLLEWQNGRDEKAFEAWTAAVTDHPQREYGSAALVALFRHASADELDAFRELAASGPLESYPGVRAWHLASDMAPYERPERIDLTMSQNAVRQTERWLARRFSIDAFVDEGISSLGGLAADGRLIRGAELWRIGLKHEAKGELESLRRALVSDALGSARLAVYLSELGLYRSSILAAANVLRLAGASVFEAPEFLGRLVYPVYYADLVLAEAEKYGYDPLLQFALIRQESLFESFATSSAVAQGLSQVIPATGEYIAGRLNWPDFDNDDLYRPYVGIAFGAYYLDQQLDAFDGNVAAALSAYNGGPGNAARWMAQGPEDIDGFLEVVDFWETREYVRRIYLGQAVYRYLYGAD